MERWALRRALAVRPLLPPTPLSAAALCGPSPPGRAPTAVNPGLTRPPPARPGSAPAPTLPPLRLSQSRSGNPQRCSRPPRSSTNQRGESRGAAPSRRALLSQSERSVSARSRRAAQPIRRGSLPLPPTARSQPIGGHGGGEGGVAPPSRARTAVSPRSTLATAAANPAPPRFPTSSIAPPLSAPLSQ